jgi:tellurite methyltransferase
MNERSLQEQFGGIDIYLFDQLLKGRVVSGMRVLDAGCGTGRNLVYFLQHGYQVFGVDQSSEAIAQVRLLAATLAPHLPPENFRVEPVERMSFEQSDGFDVIISNAVLHFAHDEAQWHAMINEMWRLLKPRGMLFARLASSIGMEQNVRLIEGRRYNLPDGSDRFLVDAAMLKAATTSLGGEFLEPIKTTIVDDLRAMTTWVIRRKETEGTGNKQTRESATEKSSVVPRPIIHRSLAPSSSLLILPGAL